MAIKIIISRAGDKDFGIVGAEFIPARRPLGILPRVATGKRRARINLAPTK